MIFTKKKQLEFQKNGYLIFKNTYNSKELINLKSKVNKIIKLAQIKKIPLTNKLGKNLRINLFNKKFTENIISDFLNIAIKKKFLQFGEKLVNSTFKMGYPYVIFTEQSDQFWHQDLIFLKKSDKKKIPKNFKLKTWQFELPFSQVLFNIPLYDDSYLWVVPGSQARELSTTEKKILKHGFETKKLNINKMKDGFNVKLKAGDCIMYHPLLIHARHSIKKNKRLTLHWYWVARNKINPFYQKAPSLNKNIYKNLSNYLRKIFPSKS